jgi:hypothetical protein
MSRIYEKFCELLSAHIEADEKWMPIQKAHELLGSVNEDEIWEQRHAAADALFTYIAELEAERRWIPVSERMPDDWESVLTIDISKSTQDVVSAFYNPETSLWSTPFSSDLWVTHWMPLPEPPIVYGKVCEE